MTRSRLHLSSIAAVLTAVNLLSVIIAPTIAFACEGAEENLNARFTLTTYLFKNNIGEEIPAVIKDLRGFGKVEVGVLSLAGKDKTLFSIQKRANCENVVLANKGATCTILIRLENVAAKEAEIRAGTEAKPSGVLEGISAKLSN